MAGVGEAALYGPIKRFLEARGYAVKGEVCGCDLVARHVDDRGDEPPVIIELKLRFTLALLLQGIDRLAISERVYVAVPRPARNARGLSPDAPAIRRLCRRVGLGLIVVGGESVTVVEEPAPYRPRAGAAAHATGCWPNSIAAPATRISADRAGVRSSPPTARTRCALSACSPRPVRCLWPNCAPPAASRTPPASCSAMSTAGSSVSDAAFTLCRQAGTRRSDLCRGGGGACRPLPSAPQPDAGDPRRRRAAPPDRRLFRPRLAAAHPAPGAGVRRLGVRRRFRPRAAPLPHAWIVRTLIRRRRSGRAAGDRAVQHGPALPGASGVSLRATDVARLRALRTADLGAAARGRRRRDVALHAGLCTRNARRPSSTPIRPSWRSRSAGSI